ncbi:retrovirus-related pol polyprotein from transposon TNT 1-94 [Tanacetum coccineum]
MEMMMVAWCSSNYVDEDGVGGLMILIVAAVVGALKNELRKLKGKNIVDTAISKPSATIAPGMFKLDIEPISHRLKNNRDAHEVYLEKTIENTDTLRGLIECARKQNPSQPLLESAFMFTKHVQELFVYVSKTFPSLTKPTEKLVAVTPMNKDKKVRFTEPVTSSSNIPKQNDSLRTKDSNKPFKKHSHKPKAEDSIQEKLYLLHMDLCELMRIQSINGRKYILVIIDDYSRFTWVKFQRSKDEVLEFVIKFLKMIQVRLNATVVRKHHNKTPYELLHDRKPDLSYLHVFGALYYPINDGEDLGKLKPKADIGIFVSYATVKKAFRIYSKRTRLIIETIHVNFNELTAMAYEQFNPRLRPKLMTLGTISSGLVQNIPSLTLYVPPTKNDWEILFQPMFDEYLNSPPCVNPQVPAVIAPKPTVSTGIPSSTTIDQDATSTSTTQTNQETPSLVIPLDVEEADHDIEVAHMDNNSYVDFPIP